ncbi:tRNA (adenosine(37)-N6)-threonylcarbamoyltransferase complex dimerization subunit type 1 TsaB [Alkalihalobacillus hemicellulosilyticus]|uniref:Inactive homolog of metal-dependent proteases n=1 Tax=Halalkalibacter hemicellulosilyticusJCM 9152 TaxID=1236971 RepID=W4QMC9_9BACI|nr:tRNA (adenosine(37)-N6)-threonylcarbamoyltransferase complex dimerization subunit type 1 TsaB [Halalkalibacter hemicellulosilyticus]GAE32479.1 inactive homolog of metal-dependent proteases [Halalkalibacter hemicellulosilyticusJCM 9152]
MTKILAIDTSSYVMGVAVTEDQSVRGELITNIKKNHSLRLMPAISQLMKEVDMHPSELDRIVVANGPGSYTGVRIGVTTAKTLAWSLKIPIVGVSSIALMAQSGRYFNGDIVPIVDARRGQVYTGLYSFEKEVYTTVKEDRLVMLDSWLEELAQREKPILIVGQDAKLHRETISAALGDNVLFSPATLAVPRPSELAFMGRKQEVSQNVHQLVPNYIQLAEAEAKWLQAQTEKSESK